ncbi:AfsR/SARP family transcriptional regulator [Nonomuraea sp. SBT364]|uniref:AfsR/SARP family transcriptional regulator n=1 Tax=Nonomuraea sp. SBT364 TaxID=1580530 RepID=UPI00066EC0D0|nr:AfsR/SARP family transcriptional regulator [Nonomuraea sp. SBT364]
MLVVLALEAGATVAFDRVCRMIWDSPPRSAASNLRTYVALVRRYLRLTGYDDYMITVRGGERGYRLCVPHGLIDVHHLNRLADSGHLALTQNRLPAAICDLTGAIGMWRGPVGSDIAASSQLRSRLDAFTFRYSGVREDLAEAQLLTGQLRSAHQNILDTLAEHPLRERSWGQLIRVSYLLGQRDAAFAAYHRAGRLLCDELGSDPGAELVRLHRALLDDDEHILKSPGQHEMSI